MAQHTRALGLPRPVSTATPCTGTDLVKKHQHHQTDGGGHHIGQHQSAELAEGHAGFGIEGIEIEVLWVAHGGHHTAQIGCHGLEHHQGDRQLLLSDHPQHDEAKGDEGDQRHIVGDDHTQHKGQKHQHKHHPPGGGGAFQQPVAQVGEQPQLLKTPSSPPSG